MSVNWVESRKRYRACVGSGLRRQYKDFINKKDALHWEALQKVARANNGFENLNYPMELLIDEYVQSISKGCTKDHIKDVERSLKELKETYKLNALRDLTILFTEKYKSESKVSAVTTNKKLGYMKAISKFAQRCGYSNKDLLLNTTKLKVRKKEKRALTEKELNEILKASKEYIPSLSNLILFLANTGCRKLEALSLEWENIDFNYNVVKIYDKPHALINGEPFRCKWGSSRVIPLKPILMDMLSTIDKSNRWVFQNENGNTLYNNLYSRFKQILKRTSIKRQEEVSIHTLRHTWISQMIYHGVPIKQVSVMAGHKSLNTTAKYAHLIGDPKTLHYHLKRMPDFGKNTQDDIADNKNEEDM